MLGVSSYFKDLSYQYLEKASKYKAKYLFTSLHIPEEDLSELSKIMPEFLTKINEYNLQLVPDISPVTFEKLNIDFKDYKKLKELGFKALRLDYGFDDFDEVKKLQQDFKIILNASVIDEQYILKAIDSGVDIKNISVLHNFYPKKDTGLSLDYFNKLNRVFVKYGIEVMAFVAGDKLRRFPRFEGLPTLEKHRSLNSYVAAIELFKNDVGVVIVGDSKACDESLEYISRYIEKKVITLPVFLNSQYQEYFDEEIKVRKDLSDKVIRLNTPRLTGISVQQNYNRNKGNIVIHNDLAGRYCGEINILKEDLSLDESCNIIGFVHPDYLELLKFIDGNTKIKFVKI